MTVPPINLSSIMLAAQVTKVLNVIHRVAYALLSPERRLVYASPNFETVVSAPDQQLTNQLIEDVMWEFVGAEDSLAAIFAGRLPFLAFERVNRVMPDGRILYLDINVTRVNSLELAPGLLVIVEDVTDQAQMEQRLVQNRNELYLIKEQLSQANLELHQLNQLKSLFLSMAAHDLRTPLTAIHACSDLILRLLPENAPANLFRYTNIIEKQAVRMDLLINDFLDLHLLEQGKLHLRLRPVNLNVVVAQVVNMLAYQAEKRQHTLVLNTAPDDIVLALDENRLQQILYNLVSNAIKYTPTEGTITISTWTEEETAVIQIADNGQGMTEEQQASAFKLYYRADNADNMAPTGWGLGLYIVKMLTEAHGGQVSLTSQPDEGSTFCVSLPMRVGNASNDEA
ncbi:MAG: HAMP domain-containing histidine kinase [Chloroflexi bacterium]|nr:HAMP domain-containing histidine kinase [Chloroflexota bacterium]